MKRHPRALVGVATVGMVLFASVMTLGIATPIHSETVENFVCSDITRLANGTYLLAGAQQVGEQPWETAPAICVRGAGGGENAYMLDGVDLSDVSQGTIAAFVSDAIEEVQVATSGFVADYGRGGGAVINMITKSGSNRFSGVTFARTDESLNDLTYDDNGTLYGAGTAFEPDPVPVLGFFDEDGAFERVGHPLERRGGFFNGAAVRGLVVVYGNTSPNVQPIKPLLMTSIDGVTWKEPESLPWTVGAINAARFLDASTGWVVGETPDGAAFAATYDGGQSWMKQTMPDATYIWDVEIAQIPVDPKVCGTSSRWTLGAALGTHYLDDGSKESIVYRYAGAMWEEMWRVPGFGGALCFDAAGDGEIGIVQNHQDGTATFSRYAAHAFFGIENLICDLEIAQIPDEAHPNEPIELHLMARGPWGGTISVDTVVWSSDFGDLEVNPDDPALAILTVPEPGEARVTCTVPDADQRTSRIVVVGSFD